MSDYDLEERVAKFGEEIIELAKNTPKNTITIPILNQLIKSRTSREILKTKFTFTKKKPWKRSIG